MRAIMWLKLCPSSPISSLCWKLKRTVRSPDSACFIRRLSLKIGFVSVRLNLKETMTTNTREMMTQVNRMYTMVLTLDITSSMENTPTVRQPV